MAAISEFAKGPNVISNRHYAPPNYLVTMQEEISSRVMGEIKLQPSSVGPIGTPGIARLEFMPVLLSDYETRRTIRITHPDLPEMQLSAPFRFSKMLGEPSLNGENNRSTISTDKLQQYFASSADSRWENIHSDWLERTPVHIENPPRRGFHNITLKTSH